MTDICRLCASLKTLEHLTPIDEPSLSLKRKLLRCCQLELPSNADVLPQNVCDNCVQRLESAWTFAESVAQAQETLQTAFSTTDFVRQPVKTVNKTERERADAQIKLQSAITSLHLQHYSAVEIASRLNVNVESVHSWVNTYESLRAKTSNVVTSNSNNESVDCKPFIVLADDQKQCIEWEPQPTECIISEEGIKSVEIDEYDENSSSSFQMADTPDEEPEPDIGESKAQATEFHADATWKELPWNCLECNTQYTNSLNIPAHFSEEHGATRLNFACIECTRKFTRLAAFVNHVKFVHRTHMKFCCDICCEFMEDEKAFAVHMANSHTDASKSYLCPTCGKGFQKSSHFYTHIKCHAPAADRAKFKCNVCEKNCSTKANLASHMRIHDGIREFTCDQCGRSFVQKGNLHAHILTHVQAKPFGCSICDKAFKTAARLATHRKVHSDYRPHKCKVCNRDFREKTTLNEHMRIHTGVMPYECEYCGKRFRFKGVLATHRRTHTGERPYSCVECDHHFTNWPNYNKHMIRRHGINTSKTVRKPQSIPPSGMPANAKLNYVVPTTNAENTATTDAEVATSSTLFNVVNGEAETGLEKSGGYMEGSIITSTGAPVIISLPNQYNYIPAGVSVTFDHINTP